MCIYVEINIVIKNGVYFKTLYKGFYSIDNLWVSIDCKNSNWRAFCLCDQLNLSAYNHSHFKQIYFWLSMVFFSLLFRFDVITAGIYLRRTCLCH